MDNERLNAILFVRTLKFNLRNTDGDMIPVPVLNQIVYLPRDKVNLMIDGFVANYNLTSKEQG